MTWYDTNWKKRKKHLISGSTAGPSSNYQIKFRLYKDDPPIDSFTLIGDSGKDVECHQGVACDGTYIYTTAGNDNLTIYKYDKGWNLIESSGTTNRQSDKAQINSIYHSGGKLLIGANNYNTTPRKGWIMIYNASDLTWDSTKTVQNQWSEGCSLHDGYWWVVSHGYMKVSQYDGSWNHVAEHDLKFGITGLNPGYQGCRWSGNYFYANIHGDNKPDKLDCYYWDGTNFHRTKRLERPTNICNQGFDIDQDGKTVRWAERNHDSVSYSDYVISSTLNFSNNEVGLENNCESDFSDIRFTSGNTTTELDYWLEYVSSNLFADAYVELSGIPESPAKATIYIYYSGGSTAVDSGSIVNTMDKVNNFNDGTTEDFTNSYGTVDSFGTDKNIVFEGVSSARLEASAGGYHTNAYTFWSQPRKIINGWFRTSGGSAERTLWFGYLESPGNILRFGINTESDEGGDIQIFNSGAWESPYDVDYQNTWVRFEAFFNTGSTSSIHFYSSNNIEIYGSSNLYLDSASRTYRDILLYNGGSNEVANYDRFYSRKYLVPEPTNAYWDTEEDVPGGGGGGTSDRHNYPNASHRAFPYFFTTDTYSNPIEGFWLTEPPTPTPTPGVDYKYKYDLAIYYDSLSGDDFVDCRCSRWDISNYSVIVETWLKQSQLDYIRDNTRPGAVGELYTILGRPRYYDKTWTGDNTLRLLPTPSCSKMNTSNLRNMRDETLIFIKNITTNPIVGSNGWVNIKIEGMVSGTGNL